VLSIEFALATMLALGAAAFAFIRFTRKYPQALLLSFLAYTVLSVNASVFFLDYQSVFISETATTSRESNASLRLMFFNLLIVLGVWFGFRIWRGLFGRLRTDVHPPSPKRCWQAFFLISAILLIALGNVLVSSQVPYPGSGFARQSFWESRIRFPFIRDAFGILIFFVPFVCAALELYGRALQRRKIVLAGRTALAIYFAYLLIGGQVFHGLLLPTTVVFALLVADRIYRGGKLLPFRRLMAFTAIGSVLVATVYTSFESRLITASFDTVGDAIVYRILALQGSTYWQSDAIWSASGGQIGSLQTLLNGREFLINSIMPGSLADSYLEAGINLQGALPATSLLSLGLPATGVLCLVYGFVLGIVTSLVYFLVYRGRVFLLLPASYLWLWTMGAYSRASLEEIASVKFLLFSLLVLVVCFARLSAVARPRQLNPRRGRGVIPQANHIGHVVQGEITASELDIPRSVFHGRNPRPRNAI
jgi:hypothetical protein